MIGGQAMVIKKKYGAGRDADAISRARRNRSSLPAARIRSASLAAKTSLPSTRMGNFAVQRGALVEAQDYMREWDDYNDKVKKGDKDAKPPKHDLKLEALADVLRGKMLVQIHCYRADELLTEMAMAKEFGYKVARLPSRAGSLQSRRRTCREGCGALPPSPTGGATSTKRGTRFPGTR